MICPYFFADLFRFRKKHNGFLLFLKELLLLSISLSNNPLAECPVFYRLLSEGSFFSLDRLGISSVMPHSIYFFTYHFIKFNNK